MAHTTLAEKEALPREKEVSFSRISYGFLALISLVLIFPLTYWVYMLTQHQALPMFLLSDILYFLLLVTAGSLHIYMKHRRSYRSQMLHICKKPLAMFSLTILAGYLAVTTLDSLHMRIPSDNSNERIAARTLSAFDLLTTPLWIKVETTYSAPFSLYSYSKESIESASGQVVRDYPRLSFGGAHLNNESERDSELLQGIAVSLCIALFIALLSLCISTALARNSFTHDNVPKRFLQTLSMTARGKAPIALVSISVAVFFVSFLVSFIAYFATSYHIFGTDKVGQDVLYQALKSIRTGILIGTLTTLIMLPFAITLGVVAGFFGGIIDDVIQYIYTTLSSIPGVLLIAASVLLLQTYLSTRDQSLDALIHSDWRLLFLCGILGITSWTGLCRILRAETLKLRELEFIRAARSSGASTLRILTVHIIPNLFHIILIIVILDFSGLVLAEAVLSYVGVGVDPTMNSWGNMINQARLELGREPIVWWSLTSAFTFMFLLVLAANILADAAREAFDPRAREAQ